MASAFYPDKLTDRQSLFVDAYVDSLNATDAARKAGYSGRFVNRTGSNLLRTRHVRKAIDDKLGKVNPSSLEITPNWVKQKIQDVIDTCTNARDKLFGLELLAKILKMFEPAPTGAGISVVTVLQTLVQQRDATTSSYNRHYVNSTTGTMPSPDAVVPRSSSTVEAIPPSTVEDSENLVEQGEQATPHPPYSYDNTDTPKNVVQKHE